MALAEQEECPAGEAVVRQGALDPAQATHLLLLSRLPKYTRGGDIEEGRKGRYLINVSDVLGRAWQV